MLLMCVSILPSSTLKSKRRLLQWCGTGQLQWYGTGQQACAGGSDKKMKPSPPHAPRRVPNKMARHSPYAPPAYAPPCLRRMPRTCMQGRDTPAPPYKALLRSGPPPQPRSW